MLPTHEHVADYRDFKIYRRRPGFEFTPVILGKIASFLVQGADGSLAAYAFMYSLLAPLDGAAIDEGALLESARRVIETAIDQGSLNDRQDATFEYRDGSWVAVRDARWWISVFH